MHRNVLLAARDDDDDDDANTKFNSVPKKSIDKLKLISISLSNLEVSKQVSAYFYFLFVSSIQINSIQKAMQTASKGIQIVRIDFIGVRDCT